jgi:osmotically-inducible protein OsmY
MAISKRFSISLTPLLMVAALACGSRSEVATPLVAEDTSGIHFFDDEISLEVETILGSVDQADYDKVRAVVRQGVVVLLGEVPSPLLRMKAQWLVGQVPGVHRVINRLRVVRKATRTRFTSA